MIITISREYGAGGHSIGKAVAHKLNIEFYDKDILREVVRKSGLTEEEILRVEEEVSPGDSFLRMIMPAAYEDQQSSVNTIERQVIQALAGKGSCVILGRCADDVLAKAGVPCLNVFLYADVIHRAARVGELIGSKNPTEIQRKMQHTDSARRAFYQRFTGKHWGDARNYALCLDTGLLGYDTCVSLICQAAEQAESFRT